MIETLADYVASQDELLQEASLALPHEFSKCTFALGHIRFPKRNFRCDCPTVAIAHPCTLRRDLEQENTANVYGPNFSAQFCRCGRPYDARTEQETMIQCLICEDWFHESCCNLRERPPSRKSSPAPLPGRSDSTEEEEHADDAQSDGSSDLPPGLITGTEYESFICGPCVSKNKTLVRWAGTPGITMVVRDTPTGPWRRIQEETPIAENFVRIDKPDNVDRTTAGSKRPLSPSNIEPPDAKRLRGDLQISQATIPCLAPPINDAAQTVYTQVDAPTETSCLPSLEANPCLLEEEETYEPPEDPDSGKDDLVKYLRPFAQEGKVVSESDVRQFFASLTEATNKGRE
ncbi:hypothetical protein H0H92_009469 [Tricholoma furcatifolium]|nr:hypothetical protein H0H92_009469 [Tricholoma furcatifolium]